MNHWLLSNIRRWRQTHWRTKYGRKSRRVWSAILPALVLSLSPNLGAEPLTGTVSATIVNGTTGGPGEVEKVALFNLASAAQPTTTLGAVSGDFTVKGIELGAGTHYLLQVTSGGVDYSEIVNFELGNEARARFIVFDVTQDASVLSVRSARFLLRLGRNRLRVEKLYVVENKAKPRRTFFDRNGTFRFHVPQDVVGAWSVFVSSNNGMPPSAQPTSRLQDGSGYVIATAFKPGTTDINISYEVDYSSGGYELRERAYYPLSQMLVLVTPSDIDLKAEGWENLTPNPKSRFVVLRQADVTRGSPIGLTLSGGSKPTAGRVDPEPEVSPAHGTITQLPDASRYQQWIIVALMSAALVYGLLAALIRDPQSLEKPLGDEPVPDDER